MLRVAVGALTPKQYGVAAYLQSILKIVPRYAGLVNFVLLTSEEGLSLPAEGGNLEVVRCKVPPSGAGLARVMWEQAALPRVIAATNADLYYSGNNLAVLRSPRPCVIHLRNMEPLVPVLPGTPLKWRARLRLLRLLSRASLRSARRVIAASQFVRQAAIGMGCPPAKISVIYHGVDDLAVVGGGQPGGYIAAAAKFIRYANLETMLRGFARARQLGYPGQLRLAGGSYDAAYENEIKDLIQKLGIAGHVRLLGYIARDDVLQMMAGCDAFVFPSTLEACPFTLLEALRQRTPIIATTAPPMPEFGGEAPLYVDPGDWQEFGNAIHRVVSSPELNRAMRSAAGARAELFRWDSTMSQLLEVFGDALRDSHNNARAAI
jgi:glycosyltransferase involved in cell wall biosynthesis